MVDNTHMSVVVKTVVSEQSELYECLMQLSDSEVVIIRKDIDTLKNTYSFIEFV